MRKLTVKLYADTMWQWEPKPNGTRLAKWFMPYENDAAILPTRRVMIHVGPNYRNFKNYT